MSGRQQSRIEPLTNPVKVTVPTFALCDVQIAGIDPGVFSAASDYARRFFPRTSLARAA